MLAKQTADKKQFKISNQNVQKLSSVPAAAVKTLGYDYCDAQSQQYSSFQHQKQVSELENLCITDPLNANSSMQDGQISSFRNNY